MVAAAESCGQIYCSALSQVEHPRYPLTPRARSATIERMSAHGDPDVIEKIVAEMREALHVLRQRPGKQGGRKVIVHIDPSWRAAMIELPPEVIQVRQD